MVFATATGYPMTGAVGTDRTAFYRGSLGYSGQTAVVAGHTSFPIASREPARFRAKLFREGKRPVTPAAGGPGGLAR